jgi:hypothetical protein
LKKGDVMTIEWEVPLQVTCALCVEVLPSDTDKPYYRDAEFKDLVAAIKELSPSFPLNELREAIDVASQNPLL